MNEFLNYNLKLLLLLCISLFTSIVNASVCFEKSPNFVNLNDEYFNIENGHLLTDIEKRTLSTFFEKIDDRWEGDVFITECTGSDEEPVEENLAATLDTSVTFESNGYLSILADMVNKKEKISGQKTLNLLGNVNAFYADFTGSSSIVYSERYLRRNAGGGGAQHIENIYHIIYSGDSLTINFSYYISGVLTAREEWSLERI